MRATQKILSSSVFRRTSIRMRSSAFLRVGLQEPKRYAIPLTNYPIRPFSFEAFPQTVPKTSGRRYKRLQRKRRKQRKALEAKYGREVAAQKSLLLEEEEEEEEDTRTWKSILFPFLIRDPNDPPPKKIPWPTTPQGWYYANKEAWKIYSASWEGFFSNVTGEKEGDGNNTDVNLDKVKDNVRRNLKFSRKEGRKLVRQAKETTGIYTLDDLKALAREMMTVATEMLKEFMKGYREGRDVEVEKMLHQYFQEDDTKDEDDKKDGEPVKRRRKRKRRIPFLLQPEIR